MKTRRADAAIRRGRTRREVVFEASPDPLGRRELHLALEPIVQKWIAAATRWREPAIGDYRFLIFSMRVPPDVELYVQFWSEPLEPVLWEVSSGRWNPPADEWLAGERAGRIEALGFAIGGKAENYRREVRIDSSADVAAVAKAVVTIFWHAFDYRGRVPIEVQCGWHGRGEKKDTFDAFTPEDLAKVFAGLRFATELSRVEAELPEDAVEAPVVIHCRKRRMTTVVRPGDQVEGQNLYRQVRLVFEPPRQTVARGRRSGAASSEAFDAARVRLDTVLPFSGGVTLDWLVARIRDWEAVLAHLRRMSRRPPHQAEPAQETIH